jgi:hypothetical protein
MFFWCAARPNGRDRSPKEHGKPTAIAVLAVKAGEAAREAGCLYGEHGDGSATLRVSEITAAPCGLPFAYV